MRQLLGNLLGGNPVKENLKSDTLQKKLMHVLEKMDHETKPQCRDWDTSTGVIKETVPEYFPKTVDSYHTSWLFTRTS